MVGFQSGPKGPRFYPFSSFPCVLTGELPRDGGRRMERVPFTLFFTWRPLSASEPELAMVEESVGGRERDLER